MRARREIENDAGIDRRRRRSSVERNDTMDQALTKLLVERERLLARVEQQRAAVATYCANLAAPAAAVDRAVDFGRFLRSHPLALAALMLGAFAFRGRSMFGLLARGIGIWRLARRLRSFARLFDR